MGHHCSKFRLSLASTREWCATQEFARSFLCGPRRYLMVHQCMAKHVGITLFSRHFRVVLKLSRCCDRRMNQKTTKMGPSQTFE